jgi:maltodextrin utilization protein YvdJ
VDTVEIKVETGDKNEGGDVDNDGENEVQIEVQSGLKGNEIYLEKEVEKEVEVDVETEGEKEVEKEVGKEVGKEVEDEVEQGERIMVPLALQAVFSCLPSMSSMDIIQGTVFRLIYRWAVLLYL